MSDSLIAFQPAMDDPSNIVPSSRNSSSTRSMSKVTCCMRPVVSVKRRSTYWTSFSLISERIFLALILEGPCLGGRKRNGRSTERPAVLRSDGLGSRLAGADADDVEDVGDEDLAVADLASAGGGLDGVDDGGDHVVRNHHLDLDLGQEVDDV